MDPVTPAVPPIECEPQVMPHEQYTAERSMLNEIMQRSADSHDKAILQLGSGALALSITFIGRIAPDPLFLTLFLLFSAWLILLASLYYMIKSFHTSQEACRFQLAIYDEEQETQKRVDRPNPHNEDTIKFTKRSHWLFWNGVVLLIVFSGINLFASKGHVQFSGDLFDEQETIRDTPAAEAEPSETGQRDSAAQATSVTTEAPNEVKEPDMANERRDTARPNDGKQAGVPTPNRPVAPAAPTSPPPSTPKK